MFKDAYTGYLKQYVCVLAYQLVSSPCQSSYYRDGLGYSDCICCNIQAQWYKEQRHRCRRKLLTNAKRQTTWQPTKQTHLHVLRNTVVVVSYNEFVYFQVNTGAGSFLDHVEDISCWSPFPPFLKPFAFTPNIIIMA